MEESWGEAQAEDPTTDATYSTATPPSYPEPVHNPHNHSYTWSPKLPDGSMLVIRAQSADELVRLTEELAPVVGQLAATWSAATRSSAPTPAPQQSWQQPGQPNWSPQAAQPNQPYAGQPAWQQAGAPQGGGYQQPKQYPPGWVKLTVPFKAKPLFDGIVQQNGFRKGDPGNGGQLSFNRDNKTWYADGQIAGAFAQFQPVPA